MHYRGAILTNLRPKPVAAPFAIGTQVLLKCCPHTQPGVVQGMRRGKVQVWWSDVGILGRHRPSALMLVEAISNEANNES